MSEAMVFLRNGAENGDHTCIIALRVIEKLERKKEMDLCILCREPDTRGLGLCQKCVSDAAIGRAVQKIDTVTRDKQAGKWDVYVSEDPDAAPDGSGPTLEAALRAAGLMEEEK